MRKGKLFPNVTEGDVIMYDKETERLRLEYDYQKNNRRADGYRYSYNDLLDVLCYANTTRISEVFNGKHRLDDNQYKRLAAEWGVRVEYLKCEDDFRTEDDMYAAAKVERTESIELHLRYLKLLGYDAQPHLAFHCHNFEEFRLLWPDLKQTIANHPINEPNEHNEYVSLDNWDGISTLPHAAYEYIVVRQTLEGSPTNEYTDSNLVSFSKYCYTLDYEISQDGKAIASVSMNDLESIFTTMDEYAKTTASLSFKRHPYHEYARQLLVLPIEQQG